MKFIFNKPVFKKSEQVSVISQEIQTQESDFLEKGIVLEIGDGVVRATGLRNVRAGEMVKVGRTKMLGMAVTLEKNTVGIIIFGNDRDLSQGD
jgi:F-type H+-transporting ATPase subunit alpha